MWCYNRKGIESRPENLWNEQVLNVEKDSPIADIDFGV